MNPKMFSKRRNGFLGSFTRTFNPNLPSIMFPLILLILTQVPNAQSLQQPEYLQPTFIKTMDSHTVKENTQIGDIVYTLQAQLDRGYPQVRIVYGIDGTNLFSVDKTSGHVKVAQSIDREQTSDSTNFQVIATAIYNTPEQTQIKKSTQLSITVFISDENDNPPKIERVKVGNSDYDSKSLNRQPFGSYLNGRSPIIRTSVSEDSPVGSVLVDLIEAIDPDKASSNPLQSTCLDCEPEFKLHSATENLLNDQFNASIILVSPLTHVPRNNIRTLHIMVSDGKFNTSIFFEVTIEDVQNKPPQFIGSTTCVVSENVPIDRTIMTIQAIDGDAIGEDENISPPMKSGAFLGRPILYDLLGNETSVEFSDFKLHPLTGQLQVKNRLDREAYLSFNNVLSLRVRARELKVDPLTLARFNNLAYESILRDLEDQTDESNSAISEVVITVILVDVNDNTPRWLNASEISRLNMDLTPDWYTSLPYDLDTGRIYHFDLKENSPPGSPITGKNDMFVYDLDNGDNANFNITLEDPFNLFDVEPKQVSGFALVTLKLAGQTKSIRRNRLIDFENPNERKFIITLIATETSTSEKFFSKAQVTINVLDVNDNAPEFESANYIANIKEDAIAGKTVVLIRAADKDAISEGQLTYSLHGHSAYLFDINRLTGLITVARCDSMVNQQQPPAHFKTRHPNTRQCIDYEVQRSHHLMVEVSDGELQTKVGLTVFIDDANDNGPVFALPVVDTVIEEGADRLDPPIKIEASDADQSSVLSYSIVEGNFNGLFSINNATGELQLTRPIIIAHDQREHMDDSGGNDYRQQQLNKITLIVQVTDGKFAANGTIRIDVLDANDNAPAFIKPHYSVEIPETLSSGHTVVAVTAIDSDRGNNARVSYRLQRGSYGQFEIDEATGEIRVSKQAVRFDLSKRENYTLEVVAYDHGFASKSSTVLVNVHVLNTIRRVPRFTPQIQRASISEATLNNTIIHRMVVSDQDQLDLSMLVFQPGPIEALDKNGQPVASSENERLGSMFSVSTSTGDVMVSSVLDHDLAAYVNFTIYVSSRQSSFVDRMSPESDQEEYNQRAEGYLMINVIDENGNAPIFAAPWSPQSTELSFQMLEELPVGSILTQLVASDVDSKISHFKIDPPNDYFELTSPQSGIIVNKRLIDYDALMRQTFLTPISHQRTLPNGSSSQLSTGTSIGNNILQFNVYVFDSGQPQLSAKATISAEILPVNDWDCKFEQPVYEVHLKESVSAGSLVVQVRATDMDYGDEHNSIRYHLVGQYSEYFKIDPSTGIITVSTEGSQSLDREGSLGKPTLILTVLGRDKEQESSQSVRGESTARQFRQQSQQVPRSCLATIKVHVDDVNDNPPLFSQKLYEATAYDTDMVEVPIIKLLVRDSDAHSPHNPPSSNLKQSSALVNSFTISEGNINNVFNISNTGLIYATKPLNGSIKSSEDLIVLKVQVKQQSASQGPGVLTSFTDECTVRIKILKINRYVPEWHSGVDFSIEENSKPGTHVARLNCIDRDYSAQPHHGRHMIDLDNLDKTPANLKRQDNTPIRYWIKENGTNTLETAEFKLDHIKGLLSTRIELDRERQDYYKLVVACEDGGKPQSLESIAQVLIRVIDVDDNKPEFIVPRAQDLSQRSLKVTKSYRPSIRFAVEEHQIQGLPVGQLEAKDRDLKGSYPISYCLIEGNEFDEFSLDRISGILYTNRTLDRERQSSYDLLVKAINDGSACEDHMIVNPTSSKGNPTANSWNNSIARSNADLRQSELTAVRDIPVPLQGADVKLLATGPSFLSIQVDVLDINDNAPIFRRPVYRAGVQHRSLMNTLVTQVAAFDPDKDLNGTLSYKISEILMYKTSPSQNQPPMRSKYDIVSTEHITPSKLIKLIQFPFRIDEQGNIYTQQLLTQYQLMSMFLVHLEATEVAEPYRTARTKLEIYVYESSSQLKIRINIPPRSVEPLQFEIESVLSKATKYTAIINRARSYHGSSADSNTKQSSQNGKQHHTIPSPSSSSSITTSTSGDQISDEPKSSNIHLIFVDNFRIVNPNLVMEKFDLTSAQLFTPQLLTQQSSSSSGANNLDDINTNRDAKHKSNSNDAASQQERAEKELQLNQLSSLIDKIALASVQSAEYHSSPSSLVGIDWLESPSVLYASITISLILIGFVICLFGCCCTSRIKDHIVKGAMDKLVKQQALQAKINDQMLASSNQAGFNGGHRNSQNGQEYFLQQGGFMSSFDATKGCVTNNNENMNILQRAMESGEFIDPNYTTLNGHVNMGAHYYDASDLEQQHQNAINNDLGQQQTEAGTSKQMDDSNISLSMGDEILNDGEDLNNQGCQLMKKTKLMGHGNGNLQHNNQRQRQQIPNK